MSRRAAPTVRIPIDLVLACFFLSFALLMGTGYLVCDSPLLDGRGIVFATLLGATPIVSIRLARESAIYELVLISGIVVSVFSLLRLAGYLWAPTYVDFPFPNAIVNAVVIGDALEYIVFGTMLFFAGLLLANLAISRYDNRGCKDAEPTKNRIRWSNILVLFVAVMLFELFVTWYLKISPYGKIRLEHYNELFQFFRVSIALDSTYFVILVAILLSDSIPSSGKYRWAFAYTLAFVGLMFLSGSRSAVMKAAMMLFASLLVVYQNKLALSPKSLLVLVLAAVLAVTAFPLATERRIETADAYRKDRLDFSSEHYPANVGGTDTLPLYERAKLSQLLGEVLNRLGQIDYAILVLTQSPNQASLDKYMSSEYIVKSIVNYLPGTPFPKAELNTSRVLNIVYRGFDEDYVRTHGYEAQLWTMWGLGFVIFGWLGGLLAIFAGGFVLGMSYCLICRWHGAYQPYAKAWFLYTVPPIVIFTHGIDHSLNVLLLTLWSFYLALYVIAKVGIKTPPPPIRSGL